MKLRHGMTVMTARYAVVLRGRNQCFPDQWWGHPIIEAEDVVALPVPEGFQRVFPGLLKG